MPEPGHHTESKGPKPTENDFDVAQRVLDTYGCDQQPGTQKYSETLRRIASTRAKGRDLFDVRHLFREPRTRYERVYLELFGSTDPDWRPKWTESSDRPLDTEMLTDLFNETDRKLRNYSRALVAIIRASTDQVDRERRERDLPEIDVMWEDVGLDPSMAPTEISEVLDFLTLLQARHGRLVELGDCSAPSGHELVLEFLSDANRLWKSLVAGARRSQSDPNYLYAVHAVDLAYGSFVDNEKRPRPKALQSLIRMEYLAAKDVIEKGGLDALSNKVHVDQFSKGALEQLLGQTEPEAEIWVHRGDLGDMLYNRARQAHGPKRKSVVRRKYIEGKLHFLLQDIANIWGQDMPLYLRQRLRGNRRSGLK